MQLVMDIAENLVAINLYEELKKRRLLQSHTLDTHQSSEQLRAIPPLSGQWLSALLAAMLEYCPGGGEKSAGDVCLPFSAEAAQRVAGPPHA